MPRIYRWWMKFSSIEKEEHQIEEADEATRFEDEGAKGAKDVNKQHDENVNITSNQQNHKQQPQSQEQQNQGQQQPQQPQPQQQQNGQQGSESQEDQSDSKDNSEEENDGKENKEGKGEENNDGDGDKNKKNNEVREGDNESEDSGDEEGNKDEENDNEDEDGEEEEDQSLSKQWNTQQTFDVTEREPTISELRSRFYRFIERIAEEDTRIEDPSGYDRYSMKMLMMRRFTKKPLKDCRVSRVREKVILILDNSGSMQWWMQNVIAITNVAMKRKDVEIYIAPNGYIEAKIENGKMVYIDDSERERFMKISNRTIIYVGDFDGANTPIELSWRNRVVWFCPEERYRLFRSHDWVSYDEEEFKGVFVRCWDLAELMNAMQRIVNIKRMFIDYHENDEFDDDYD